MEISALRSLPLECRYASGLQVTLEGATRSASWVRRTSLRRGVKIPELPSVDLSCSDRLLYTIRDVSQKIHPLVRGEASLTIGIERILVVAEGHV